MFVCFNRFVAVFACSTADCFKISQPLVLATPFSTLYFMVFEIVPGKKGWNLLAAVCCVQFMFWIWHCAGTFASLCVWQPYATSFAQLCWNHDWSPWRLRVAFLNQYGFRLCCITQGRLSCPEMEANWVFLTHFGYLVALPTTCAGLAYFMFLLACWHFPLTRTQHRETARLPGNASRDCQKTGHFPVPSIGSLVDE